PIEVIEDTTQETHNDAQAALHALQAGAERSGPGARSARLAQDDELAEGARRDRLGGEAAARSAGGRVGATRRYPGTAKTTTRIGVQE
ncbi:MAG TPA: hypothetical protein VIZ60_10805, partial [Rubrobacter sp.]